MNKILFILFEYDNRDININGIIFSDWDEVNEQDDKYVKRLNIFAFSSQT